MKLPILKNKVFLGVLILVIVGGGYGYFNYSKKPTTSYKTETVSKGLLTVAVSGSGNVAVEKSETVSPSISGQVYDLAVKYGDKVSEGQTLYKIQNDQLDVSVNQAYSTYLQAKETVNTNEFNVTKAKSDQTTVNDDSESTDQDKAVASEKVRAAEAALELSKTSRDNAYGNYNLQKKNAALRTVKAPIDGTITTLNIKNGDQVGSGSSSSSSTTTSSASSGSSSSGLVIADLGSMKASVSINEVDAAKVKADQKVSITFDAIDDLTLTGKVERISTIGSESSGVVTYPVTIAFDSLDERVKPQMSLTATITTEVKENVLILSSSAVKTSGETHYVMVMKNNQPEQTNVEIGSTSDTETEIKSGLSEGDVVVTQTITDSNTNSSTTTRQNSNLNLRSLTGEGGGGPPPNMQRAN